MLWSGIKHFAQAEFACKCGKCGSDSSEMDMHFTQDMEL